MKTLSNPCLKHSSSISQAMLGGCPMLCLMRARRCLCVLRTPDFGLRTSYFGLRSRFPIFVFKFVYKTISLSFITTNETVNNLKAERVGELCYEV